MKNILVIGGNRGIGYYLVKQLIEDSYKVSVLDLEVDNLTESESLLPLICDVSDIGQVNQAIKESINKFGPVDCCVHNACYCTFESMEDTSIDTYKKVFDVNYFGALNLTKALINPMKENGYGKIIFTSSGVGTMGFINISPYASSKAALESLTKCLNLEYEDDNISFHIFHPPLTDTRSASGIQVPKEFKMTPEKVGSGLGKNIEKNSFIICHSGLQAFQIKLMYMFPIKMGQMMAKATKRAIENE